MPLIAYILVGFVGYLLGSIPTGYLVARAKGVDIRTVGSGNIGATNVFRILGKPAGILVLVADALKGSMAVALLPLAANSLFQPTAGVHAREWLGISAGLGAILGHNYTCWLHFKGGKGIATSAGVVVTLLPWPFLILLVLWVVVFAISRYVSLASISAAVALPFATWITRQSATMILITAAIAALAIYKHRSNIQRLMKGTENRIGGKKIPPARDSSASA